MAGIVAQVRLTFQMEERNFMRIIVGMSGASGVIMGYYLLDALR